MTEFLNGFNGDTLGDTITMICFIAIPVGLVAGWCLESWRTRNHTEGDWRKIVEGNKK